LVENEKGRNALLKQIVLSVYSIDRRRLDMNSLAQNPTKAETLFSAVNVKKRYDTLGGGYWALKGIDLKVSCGECIAVVGKSGSGKSTLLNLLGGIDRQTEGTIEICGTSVGSMSENQLSRFRGQNIGFVFQFFQLMPTLTCLENVMLPMDFLKKIPSAKRRLRAEDLLKRAGVLDQACKFPSALSGGEQQRVAIARALANDPAIILADEPTGNLDSQTSDDIFRMLQGLAQEGKSVVMVTHNEELAARCSRLIRISDGLIVSDIR
jgi:putative ABC transport system ATP-binding protein